MKKAEAFFVVFIKGIRGINDIKGIKARHCRIVPGGGEKLRCGILQRKEVRSHMEKEKKSCRVLESAEEMAQERTEEKRKR